MGVGIRRHPGSTLEIIYDSTDQDPTKVRNRDFEDDPQPEVLTAKHLWHLIVDANWGTDFSLAHAMKQPQYGSRRRTTIDFIARARLRKTRVCVVHVHNVSASKTPSTVIKCLRQLAMDIARYQVDILGGDMNGMAYRTFKNQNGYNVEYGGCNLVLSTLMRFVNEILSAEGPGRSPYRLHVQKVSGLRQKDIDEMNRLYEEWYTSTNRESEGPKVAPWELPDGVHPHFDCMMVYFFGWGHMDKEIELYKENSEFYGMPPYVLQVSEYLMNLDREHLWLGAVDNDAHLPILVRATCTVDKGKRKRTSQGHAGQAVRAEQRKGQGKGQHASRPAHAAQSSWQEQQPQQGGWSWGSWSSWGSGSWHDQPSQGSSSSSSWWRRD
jgi:hypothetical protein